MPKPTKPVIPPVVIPKGAPKPIVVVSRAGDKQAMPMKLPVQNVSIGKQKMTPVKPGDQYTGRKLEDFFRYDDPASRIDTNREQNYTLPDGSKITVQKKPRQS